MRKLTEEDVLMEGDLIKLKSCVKATPVCLLVGFKVCEIRWYVQDDLEGFYRILVDPEFKTGTIIIKNGEEL